MRVASALHYSNGKTMVIHMRACPMPEWLLERRTRRERSSDRFCDLCGRNNALL
jgi:hypothetical protein